MTTTDEHGIGPLAGRTLAGFVLGAAVLLLIDGVLALAGVSRFGRASGWLAAILPVWRMVEEFRAERVRGRGAVALVGAVLGLAFGLLAAGLAAGLPPLASGLLGAAVAVAAYILIWHYAIRWLGAR